MTQDRQVFSVRFDIHGVLDDEYYEPPETLSCRPKVEDAELAQSVRQVSFDSMDLPTPTTATPSSKEVVTDKDSHQKSIFKKELVSPSSLVTIELTSFWLSHNAEKLFSPKHGEIPEEAVQDMIQRLDKALKDKNDFGDILQGGKDALLFLSRADLATIAVKARHILWALRYSKETIDQCQRFSFRECCDRAAAHLATMVPRNQQARGITVTRWFRLFRRNRTFELPPEKKVLVLTREALAAYFRANPEMHNVFLHHMTRYLRTGISDNLACATAFNYFMGTLLPIGAKEEGYSEDNFQWYLGIHHLTFLNQTTFEAWFRDILVEHRPKG